MVTHYTIAFTGNDGAYYERSINVEDWSAVEKEINALEELGAHGLLVTDDDERVLYECGTDYTFF